MFSFTIWILNFVFFSPLFFLSLLERQFFMKGKDFKIKSTFSWVQRLLRVRGHFGEGKAIAKNRGVNIWRELNWTAWRMTSRFGGVALSQSRDILIGTKKSSIRKINSIRRCIRRHSLWRATANCQLLTANCQLPDTTISGILENHNIVFLCKAQAPCQNLCLNPFVVPRPRRTNHISTSPALHDRF
jgi:hypothetical protein